MTILKISLFTLFFGLFGLSSGLYFHIAETERKCFIEEIPDETMVTGKYIIKMFTYTRGQACARLRFFSFFQILYRSGIFFSIQWPRANPAIMIYNSSVVKFYNTRPVA